MGLWLKCPKCQAANPLDLKSCTACNASLENLPAAQRVYLLGTVAPAAPKTAPPQTAPAAPPAAPAVAAAPVSLEVISSTEPPPKRVKGPKGVKKKK